MTLDKFSKEIVLAQGIESGIVLQHGDDLSIKPRLLERIDCLRVLAQRYMDQGNVVVVLRIIARFGMLIQKLSGLVLAAGERMGMRNSGNRHFVIRFELLVVVINRLVILAGQFQSPGQVQMCERSLRIEFEGLLAM